MKGRYVTLTVLVRVNQIEVTREKCIGLDETELNRASDMRRFREAVAGVYPEGRITWAFSWRALIDQTQQYVENRALAKEYHDLYGDDVTYVAGGYFPNAFSTREEVRSEIHDGLKLVREEIGVEPKSVICGFLSSQNMQWLAEEENIHVCQGNIWIQYSIDNQDGDGSVSYPYYPSTEHFCKPAQGAEDFVDCVNLDGWTVDFLAGRRAGFADGFNSRMGIGPIETLAAFDRETALKELCELTKFHFTEGVKDNGFGWVTAIWELSLLRDPLGVHENFRCLPEWLSFIRENWPDAELISKGEFGLKWREENKDNSNLFYHFRQKGTGVGGSDIDKEVEWYMNRYFRLGFIMDLGGGNRKVMDFTRYDRSAAEPAERIRNWSLMGEINQKGLRPCDTPRPFGELPEEDRKYILGVLPELGSLM